MLPPAEAAAGNPFLERKLLPGVARLLQRPIGGPDIGGPDMGGPDMGGPDMGGAPEIEGIAAGAGQVDVWCFARASRDDFDRDERPSASE